MESKISVVICPGGAYQHLSVREAEPVARAFEAMGCEAAVLHYRIRESEDMPPVGLEPVHQLSETVARLKASGKPVIVCGFSAGGHLAAMLGVHWKRLGLCRPDALILCYPVITAEVPFCNAESIQNIAGDENHDFFSVEKHVSTDTPPTFLWHTASDRVVPVENALRFASALSRYSIPFELHIYPFGEHGLSLATREVAQPEKNRMPDPHVAGWIRECEAWINQMNFS